MNLSDVAKKMIKVICISLLALVAASAAYYRSMSFLPFAIGASLGAGHNVLKIGMLDRAVEKSMAMEAKKARNYMLVQYFLRFSLTALVLIFSALVNFISIYGATAGVLTYQIAAFTIKRN